jgi:hypothetical protein
VAVVDKLFTEPYLPSIILDKAFAKCHRGFDECPRHSAKNTILCYSWFGVKLKDVYIPQFAKAKKENGEQASKHCKH